MKLENTEKITISKSKFTINEKDIEGGEGGDKNLKTFFGDFLGGGEEDDDGNTKGRDRERLHPCLDLAIPRRTPASRFLPKVLFG